MAMMERANTRDYTKWWQKPGTFPANVQQPKPPIEPRPISVRENYIRCVRGEKPFWMPAYGYESNTVWPDAMEECPVPEVAGFDWWGVEWAPSSKIGGMMVKPGTRTINDFANWRDEFEFPDVSKVDFKTDGEKIAASLDPERPHIYECVKGIFERLNEVIPFDEALLAFYEEPEALADFFRCMADYKIETCTKIFENYGRVDGVCYHDDWGTQRAPFFSEDMFREQLLPETKRFFSFIKGTGRFIELHSCGRNMDYVPMMLEMGVDMWTPQDGVNDPDFLVPEYGDKMAFAFRVKGINGPGVTEEQVRRAVRDFVDTYGKCGRVMAQLRVDPEYSERLPWARDELYNYSLEYYNKLYDR